MRAARIIRYPIDVISVLVVLSTLSLQLLALVRGHTNPADAPPGKFG